MEGFFFKSRQFAWFAIVGKVRGSHRNAARRWCSTVLFWLGSLLLLFFGNEIRNGLFIPLCALRRRGGFIGFLNQPEFYWDHSMVQRVLIAFTVIGIIAVITLLPLPRNLPTKVHLRFCGHPEDFWSRVERLAGFRLRLGVTHCCSSGNMLSDLRMINAAQEIYRNEHGAYATSVDQLTNANLRLTNYTFRFISDGKRWSVAVPQQDLFAGDYLFTSDYKVYFSTTGAATTNDVDLFDARQR